MSGAVPTPLDSNTHDRVWQLNAGLRFYPFDSRRSGDWMVELDDATGRTQRVVVSAALHEGLQRLTPPKSITELRAQLAAEGWNEEALRELVAALEGDCRQRRLLVSADLASVPAVEQRVRPKYMAAMLQLLPPAAVNPLARLLSPLFSIPGAILGLLSAALGFYLLFTGMAIDRGFSRPSAEDVLLTLALVGLTLLFHELGHAAAAWRAGARRVSIGVGWYVFFPVAYADLSEVWRLSACRRIVVNLAGVYLQAIALLLLMLAYRATGHAALLAAGAASAAAIVWNLNPLIRLDGYWVLSDLLKTTDLRAEGLQALREYWARLRGRGARKRPSLVRPLPPVVATFLAVYALVCTVFLVLVIFVALARFSGAITGLAQSGQALLSGMNWSHASWAAIVLMVGAVLWKLAMIWFTSRFLLLQANSFLLWGRARLRSIPTPVGHSGHACPHQPRGE